MYILQKDRLHFTVHNTTHCVDLIIYHIPRGLYTVKLLKNHNFDIF